MNSILRRKLLSLSIGETVDLRPHDIPYSVQRAGEIVYRSIPHLPDTPYQCIRAKTPTTTIEKLSKAMNIPFEAE